MRLKMKKIVSTLIIDVFVVFLGVMAIFCNVAVPKDGWSISISYVESDTSLVGETCQLFYAEKNEDFSQENSSMQDISEELTVIFALPATGMEKLSFRLDPISEKNDI